jgi:DNA repair protein RecO (recombination protein O)
VREEVTSRGIVIGRMPFSNTSLLVTWATGPAGVIKTMAKGALGPKPSPGLALDLFYLCEIRYVPSPRSEIAALREAKLLNPFLALRREWNVLLCAQYFADLLASLSEPHGDISEHFDIFEKALVYMETHAPSRKLVDRYETRMLELSGLSTEGPRALRDAVETYHHRIPATRQRLLDTLKT